MKHNRLWFKNRIGKKIYCNDHNYSDFGLCEGILIDNELVADNLMSHKKRGIIFRDSK